MTVRAKFICNSLDLAVTPESQSTASFNAIYGKEGENADFARATPYGTLTMGIDGGTAAATFFELGKSYYLTFEEAPE
jgi:hypothetical protein